MEREANVPPFWSIASGDSADDYVSFLMLIGFEITYHILRQKVQPTKHYSNVHPCLSKNNPELGCLFPLRSVSHQFKAFVDRQIEMQGLVKKKPLNFQIRVCLFNLLTLLILISNVLNV